MILASRKPGSSFMGWAHGARRKASTCLRMVVLGDACRVPGKGALSAGIRRKPSSSCDGGTTTRAGVYSASGISGRLAVAVRSTGGCSGLEELAFCSACSSGREAVVSGCRGAWATAPESAGAGVSVPAASGRLSAQYKPSISTRAKPPRSRMAFPLQPLAGGSRCFWTCSHTAGEGVSQPDSAGVSGRSSNVLRNSSSTDLNSCGSSISFSGVTRCKRFRFSGDERFVQDSLEVLAGFEQLAFAGSYGDAELLGDFFMAESLNSV